jgi:tetratricopeptide (TPR) repeat protein
VADVLNEAHVLRANYELAEAATRYHTALAELPSTHSLEGAQTQKWQAVVAYGLGNIEQARSFFRDAQVTFDELRSESPSQQLTLESAHCHYNRAQLEYATGHFARSKKEFAAALTQYEPRSRDWRECALLQALLFLRIPGGAARARELIAQVEEIQEAEGATQSELVLTCRVKTEEALTEGDWSRARSELDPAIRFVATASTPGDRAEAADLLVLMGRVDVAAGLLGNAHDRMTAAIDQLKRLPPLPLGDHSRTSSAKLDLAVLALAMGNLTDSIRLLTQLDGAFRGHDRELEEARRRDALGSAHQAENHLIQAASYHRSARKLYRSAEFSTFQAQISTVNLACDHLLVKKVRYVERAARMLRKAARKLAPLDQDGRELARCHTNLGVALAILDDLDAAEAALDAAVLDYGRCGLWLEQTIPRHNHGVIQIRRALALDNRGTTAALDRALEDLVPAFIVRDSARFDMTLPRHRRAWWMSQSAKTLSLALRVATMAEKPQLVAELITAARLSGGLTARDRSAASRRALVGDLEIAGGVVSVKGADRVDALSSADNLVLVPGPQVQMPWGSLALSGYFSLITKEQDGSARPSRTGSVIELV